MKIRVGFVSNSSSTCFILKFDKEVQEYNLEEFKSYLNVPNSQGSVEALYNRLSNKIPDFYTTYSLVLEDLDGGERDQELYDVLLDNEDYLEKRDILIDSFQY